MRMRIAHSAAARPRSFNNADQRNTSLHLKWLSQYKRCTLGGISWKLAPQEVSKRTLDAKGFPAKRDSRVCNNEQPKISAQLVRHPLRRAAVRVDRDHALLVEGRRAAIWWRAADYTRVLMHGHLNDISQRAAEMLIAMLPNRVCPALRSVQARRARCLVVQPHW